MIGSRISPALASGLAAIAIVVVIALGAIPGLVGAALRGVDAGSATRGLRLTVALHDGQQETYRARFDGRSIFFKPRAPERPRPAPVITTTEPEPPKPVTPTGPVIPSRYSGPAIMAFVGDTVWFQGNLRVSVGEENDQVRVISVDAPWSARLEHRGGEYDVALFDRTDEKLFATAPPTSRLPGIIPVVDDDSKNPAGTDEESSADDGSASSR